MEENNVKHNGALFQRHCLLLLLHISSAHLGMVREKRVHAGSPARASGDTKAEKQNAPFFHH